MLRTCCCSLAWTLGMALFSLGAVATPAWATGHWNVPSSLMQCFGYGNGGGYHAPLILGPINCQGIFATNEVRLPASPRPAYSAWGPTRGHFAAEASVLHPNHLPPARAWGSPTPVRQNDLFAPPPRAPETRAPEKKDSLKKKDKKPTAPSDSSIDPDQMPMPTI